MPILEHLPSFDGLFSWFILTVLGLSSAILVTDSVGLLPKFLQKIIFRNRSAQTIEVLKELGFDVGRTKQLNRASKIAQNRTPENLEFAAKKLTNSHKIVKPILVGRIDTVATNSFIDLMGATCNHTKAIDAAQQLSSLWRNLISSSGANEIPDFDIVAAPKAGSPFIAYEFAKLHGKPLILHNEHPKFQSDDADFAANFDAEVEPKSGSVVIIVDDSTTGGRKAEETIINLRNAGFQVSDFLVIFEPQTKKSFGRNAAERLSNHHVRLHSIIKTE
ncbi:MAG: hypothetical protein II336_14030 [Loktanella sp.]|nr:hypothetical protein [Loktanella sp.]